MTETLSIYLVCGEPSGDFLGDRLMRKLIAETGSQVRFRGVGGPAMRAQGLESLFAMEELAVMGLVEVLPHARRILHRMGQVARDVRDTRPDVVITIDAPSFSIGVARRLRDFEVPKIHYVSPTVWAWRPWRTGKFARLFDCLMTLLPFEPAFFADTDLDCRFVGHPIVESDAVGGSGKSFRRSRGIGDEETVLCILPGSRRGEITRLAEVFGEALDILERQVGAFRVVVPTVPGMATLVRNSVQAWPGTPLVIKDTQEKYDAMAAGNAAIVASGTATLELALAGTPMVVAYRVAPVTAFLLRRMIRTPYAALANILLDIEIIPELLQKDCTPEALAKHLLPLLGPAGGAQLQALAPALRQIGFGDTKPPSGRAAEVVMGYAKRRSTTPNQ